MEDSRPRHQIVVVTHEDKIVARLSTCLLDEDVEKAVYEQRVWWEIELRPGQEFATVDPDGVMTRWPAPIPPYATPAESWGGKAVKGRRLWEEGKVFVTTANEETNIDWASGWVKGDSGKYIVTAYLHKTGYWATGYPAGSVSGECSCPYWKSLCSHILALMFATFIELD